MTVALDPAVAGMLAFVRQARRGAGRASVAQARAGLRTLATAMRSPAATVPVHASTDIRLPGGTPARVYRATETGAAAVPTIVFFHGGGFVIGDLDTHDHLCRWLCRETGAVVLSVEYRLAPEAPFPAALDDCLTAVRWASTEAGSLGGDPHRIAVAGDSAGGNLAAVTAQQLRDQGGPALAAQLLICPATDLRANAHYPSRTENADGYFLTAADLLWFAECYLGGLPGSARDATSAQLSPLLGDLNGLPPAVVVTAQFDPLRDEGEAYADALRDAGTPVTLQRCAGLIHGFFDLTTLSPSCAAAVRTMCAAFRDLLNR